MPSSDDMPEENSILTTTQREFLLKSEAERSELKQNTLYKKWSRLKRRVHAGMWDFGLLFSQIDTDQIAKFYDGPDPRPGDIENVSRVSLEGFSDHAANVVAFLYRVLPYSVFLRVIEVGIYRAERYGEGRRMISVDVDPSAINRDYAPTEENSDIYNIEELITKRLDGDDLTEREEMALNNITKEYKRSRRRD